MIRTAASIIAAHRILSAVKPDPTGLDLLLAASIISWAVEKDEAEQAALRAGNVVELRAWRRANP